MILRSPYPDVEIPNVSLPEFVLQQAPQEGDKPALIDGPTGRVVTYAQLEGAVARVATGLAERGLGRGDVLGIFAPNVPEFAVTFLAVASVGGVSTTVNSLYTAEEAVFQLKDAGAKVLVTVEPFMDRAADAASRAGVQELFVLGEAEGATPFTALLDNDGSALPVDVDPNQDLVVLPYSSGTTGFPKGVMLTHHNLVSNICQMKAVHRVAPDDRIMGVLPFFHIYGMVVIMASVLHQGATIITMPRFDLEQFLQLMQDQAITRAYLVPPIVLGLAKHPLVDRFDLSSLQLIMSGAAPLDGGLASACEERLGCRVIQGYGLTETSPVTHLTPADDPAQNKPGSIGPLIPNTEARVVDIDIGQDAETSRDGEIWIRGPQVMRGYLNNPEATRATIDEDGWLHTGDIGHADEDGYFTISDRLKELIKYKGFQVPPAELEAVLLSHPAVADAAVIPKPDEEAGELPKAFVVSKAEVTADELIGYVAGRVASHKKVREVEFIEEIPKSPSGKILRRVLVTRERQKHG